MKRAAASKTVHRMRLSQGCVLAYMLLMAGTAWAEVPDCGSVLTDASRSIAARRELASQCVAAACKQEAQELQLAPEATARYLKMCLIDDAEPLLAGEPAVNAAAVSADGPDIACAPGERCSDPSVELEATASGVVANSSASPGHTFVRVQRINETRQR